MIAPRNNRRRDQMPRPIPVMQAFDADRRNDPQPQKHRTYGRHVVDRRGRDAPRIGKRVRAPQLASAGTSQARRPKTARGKSGPASGTADGRLGKVSLWMISPWVPIGVSVVAVLVTLGSFFLPALPSLGSGTDTFFSSRRGGGVLLSIPLARRSSVFSSVLVLPRLVSSSLSIALIRRSMCGWKSRALSTGAAWRKARLRKPSGALAGAGNAAPSISTGMTGIFLASAASISMRTQSVSSVNLSLPLSSGVAQRGPTMATRISQRSSDSERARGNRVQRESIRCP